MPFLVFAAISIFLTVPFETFGDGTEFAISSTVFGISHPPSYPFFILFSKLFYWLPLGNIAFRINLFSALTAAVAVYIIYNFFADNLIDKVFLALITFFSHTFLTNAVAGEVYALNLLFFVSILFLLENITDKRNFYLAAFLLGVGSGNHHTILFLLIYLAYRLLKKDADISMRDVIVAATLFISGFSCYLYLPIRAINKPIWNWGNPYNLELFLNSFFRHDFQSQGLMRDSITFLSQIVTFNPVTEFGLIGGIIVIFSLVFIIITRREKAIKIAILIFLYSVFIVILLGNDTLTNAERKETYPVFFIPAYFLLAYSVVISIRNLKHAYKLIIYSVLAISVFINQRDTFKELLSFDNHAFQHDLARAQLATLPKNSTLILVGGEMDFPLIYQQKIGRFREDVKIINLAMLGKKWNFRESLEAGSTYTRGYEGETDSKKQILKAVILFQKEFRNKRVFLNVFDRQELPETLQYSLNGLFYETEKRADLTLDYIRVKRIEGAPLVFKKLLLAAKEAYEKAGNFKESQNAKYLSEKISLN